MNHIILQRASCIEQTCHTLCRGWLEVYLTTASEAEAQQKQLTETLLACLLQLTHYIGDTGHHPAKQQRAWHTQQVLSADSLLCALQQLVVLRSRPPGIGALAGWHMQRHCAWRAALRHQMPRQGHTCAIKALMRGQVILPCCLPIKRSGQICPAPCVRPELSCDVQAVVLQLLPLLGRVAGQEASSSRRLAGGLLSCLLGTCSQARSTLLRAPTFNVSTMLSSRLQVCITRQMAPSNAIMCEESYVALADSEVPSVTGHCPGSCMTLSSYLSHANGPASPQWDQCQDAKCSQPCHDQPKSACCSGASGSAPAQA